MSSAQTIPALVTSAQTVSTAASAQARAARKLQASPLPPKLALWHENRHSREPQPFRFRQAPLLLAAGAFCAGILLAHQYQPVIVLLLAVTLLALLSLAALRSHGGRTAVMPVAAVWIAAGMLAAELQPGPPVQRDLVPYVDGLSRTVLGRVVRVRELPPAAQAADADETWDSDEGPDAAAEAAKSSHLVDLELESIEELTPDVSRMVPLGPGAGVRMTVLAGAAATLRCGDRVESTMRLKLPERYRDPGAWQYADFLAEQGIVAHATVKQVFLASANGSGAGTGTAISAGIDPGTNPARSPADRQVSTENSSSLTAAGLRCQVYALQSWASDRMLAFSRSRPNDLLPGALHLTTDDAGMLNAMLTGDRSRLNRQVRGGFERTGSFHLFVVSGLHVSLVAAGLFLLLRRLRLSDASATLVTLPLVAAYAVLTGFGAPVARALAMTAVFLLARLWSRERNALNALGAAALAALVWSPRSLFESSFQMTFLAIVAIAGIALPLGERGLLAYAGAARDPGAIWLDAALEPRLAQVRVLLRTAGEALAAFVPKRRRRLARALSRLPSAVFRACLWGLELLLIGVVTELVMVLPMAVYFHRAALFALPANLVSVPVVEILAPLAMLTFFCTLISGWLALVPAALTALLLHGITAAVGHLSRVPGADWRVPGPVWWVAMLAVAGLALCCWAVRRSRRWTWVAVSLLPAVAALALWPEPIERQAARLEVTALDVGQGDSLLVVGPDGHTMLIDAGGPTGAAGRLSGQTNDRGLDVGEEVVSNYLWTRRIRRLDVVALTHAHSDHMGGMPAVLRNLRPRELWVSVDAKSIAYAELLTEAASLGITVRHLRAGDRLTWDDTEVRVLAPAPGYVNHGAPTNNDSLVLRMDYGKASVLLEGDAEATSERAMLEAGLGGPVTLLKIGHHGSRTSSGAAFVAAAAPRDAVLSAGKGNPFGHPRREVVERFADAHVQLYRTDELGLTTFLLTRDGAIAESVGMADMPTHGLPY